MKKLIQVLFVIVIVLAIFIGQSEAQKLFEGYWEQTMNSKSTIPGTPANNIEKQKVFYKTGKMKMVNLEKDEIMIIRVDKELAWNIDKKKGTYTEMKFADMQEGMKQVGDAMKKKQSEMKDMPPEQRAMMEKYMGKKMMGMMGDEGGMKISFKKTNETRTINGYKCYKVLYITNEEPLMEMWMTDKYQLGSEFIHLYKKMGMLKGELPEEAKNIKGFAIQSVVNMDLGMGKMESVTTVDKIVPQSISDSEFELPNGLKKIEMPMFKNL